MVTTVYSTYLHSGHRTQSRQSTFCQTVRRQNLHRLTPIYLYGSQGHVNASEFSRCCSPWVIVVHTYTRSVLHIAHGLYHVFHNYSHICMHDFHDSFMCDHDSRCLRCLRRWQHLVIYSKYRQLYLCIPDIRYIRS